MREVQEMQKAKETKRTVVYKAPEEQEGSAAIETVYVAKHALGQPFPESITLTIDA